MEGMISTGGVHGGCKDFYYRPQLLRCSDWDKFMYASALSS